MNIGIEQQNVRALKSRSLPISTPHSSSDRQRKMATVYENGRFFRTADGSFASAMIVENGVISHVGSETDHPVQIAKENKTLVVDMKGRTILPGFIDGHMHLLLLGQSLNTLSLEQCKNLEDIRATIKNYAAANPSIPRILCRGWMHSMTDGVALASMIDDLDPRPIFINSKDLHSAWCNTAALEELTCESMPDPEGGKIHRDANGKVSGLISEAAAQILVWPHVAKLAPMEDKVDAIKQAIDAYTRVGYTGMIDMAMDENCWEAFQVLRAQEKDLPIRLAAHWIINPSKDESVNIRQVDRAIELHKQFNTETSPNFRIAGIKVICDGVIDACTATLLEPYSSNGASPDALWTREMLDPVVKKADEAGLQVALHAIGDGAIKLAVDALEKCRQGRRHRVEHLELAAPAEAKRLGELQITASIQPVHADPAILRAWPKLLGEQRSSRAFPYKEFLTGGAILALGSDSPTAPYAPLVNMYTATTRRSARQPLEITTVNPEAALSLAAAVSAATQGAAYSCFADKWTGRLEVGLKADFVVMELEWTPEKLLQGRVCQTWFEGRKVYDVEA
ncbi:hypothetical protein B7463_g7614, partial [Scytalidium lignicola]